jgi:hypothetical protein
MQFADLNTAQSLEDVDIPGYRLHQLSGDRKSIWSITCSGLIEMDTLIKDNAVNYWSPHESKTSIQELPERI